MDHHGPSDGGSWRLWINSPDPSLLRPEALGSLWEPSVSFGWSVREGDVLEELGVASPITAALFLGTPGPSTIQGLCEPHLIYGGEGETLRYLQSGLENSVKVSWNLYSRPGILKPTPLPSLIVHSLPFVTQGPGTSPSLKCFPLIWLQRSWFFHMCVSHTCHGLTPFLNHSLLLSLNPCKLCHPSGATDRRPPDIGSI